MPNKQLIIEIDAKADKALTQLKLTKNALKRLESEINKSTTATERMQIKLEETTNAVGDFVENLKTLATSFISLEGAKNYIELLGNIENGYIKIAKTTGLTGKEFEELKEKLTELSTTLTGVTLQELQQIAETAGQLGISGKDNILKFTETIAKIGVATDLTAEEAAKSMANLSNVLKISINDTERLGSVINELSNTTNATAKDLVDISLRFAGAGRTAGLVTTEIMALSATLKQIGLNNEVAGTALNNFFGSLLIKSKEISKALGKEGQNFEQMVKNKPLKAMEIFLNKLNSLDKISKSNMLNKLGFNDTGLLNTMYILSENIELIEKNLKTANQEWKNNQSLAKEFNTASQSLNNQLTKTKQTLLKLATEIGNELLPTIKEINNKFADFVNNLDNEKLSNFGEAIKHLIKSLATLGGVFATVLGGIVNLIGAVPELTSAVIVLAVAYKTLSTGFGLIEAVASKSGAVIDNYISSINNLNSLLKNMGVNFTLSAGAIGAIMAVVAGLVIEYDTLATNITKANTKASQETIKHTEALQKVSNYLAEVNKQYKQNGAIEEALKEKTEKRLKAEIESLENYINQQKTKGDLTDSEKLQIESLTNTLEMYKQKLSEIEAMQTYKKQADSATKLKEVVKIYTEEELQKLNELNAKRIKDYSNTLEQLKQKELTLTQDIENLNKELLEKLNQIHNERLQRNLAIDMQIKNLELQGVSEYQAYLEKKRMADEFYNQAKLALEAQNFELYKTYISQYENLINELGNKEIQQDGQIMLTKEQTRQIQIQGLQQLKEIENNYYLEKEAKEIEAHNRAIEQKKAELEAVKAQILAQQELLNLTKRLAEALTGKKFNINTTQAQQEIKKLDEQIKKLDEQIKTPKNIKVTADTTQAQNNISKTTNKRYITLITVGAEAGEAERKIIEVGTKARDTKADIPVGADTTEAEQNIKEIATQKVENTKADIPVGADTTEAEQNINNFNIEPKDLVIQADTAQAQQEVNNLVTKITTTTPTTTIKADATQPYNVIAQLKKPTSSTHTIYVRTVQTKASGGFVMDNNKLMKYNKISRNYSSGGKVAGDDPTNSDKVPALLTGGEFVIKRDSVKKIGLPRLEYINRLGDIPKFANGGYVGSSSNQPLRPVILNINNDKFNLLADDEVANKLLNYLNN